jgi:hypothetical protein
MRRRTMSGHFCVLPKGFFPTTQHLITERKSDYLCTLSREHPSNRPRLDTLVALKFLHRTDDNYANTPETDLFLDRRKLRYIGGILEMANARLYPFWGHLTEALRTGRPQSESFVHKRVLYREVHGIGLRLLVTECFANAADGPEDEPASSPLRSMLLISPSLTEKTCRTSLSERTSP